MGKGIDKVMRSSKRTQKRELRNIMMIEHSVKDMAE